VTDLSTAEQRARAGISPKGRTIRRGPPNGADMVRVDGATYPIVGEEEMVLLTEEEIRQRCEAFTAEQHQRHASRTASRIATPLFRRLREVTDALGVLQAPKARAVQSTPGGGEGAVFPPGGDENGIAHAHADEIVKRFREITKAVERLEELRDAHLGLASAREYVLMDTYDKNSVILTEFEGWRPEEVEAFEPALGKARTIRWVRELWAADPKNGHWGARRGVCGHVPEKCDCTGVRKATTAKTN
jgi:hypothetical protein